MTNDTIEVSVENIYDEQGLLERISKGDRRAFDLLYKKWHQEVRNFLNLFEPAKPHIDELTQDVFVRLWEKQALLDSIGYFRGYLFMITKNIVLNFVRSLKTQVVLTSLEDSEGEVAEGLYSYSNPESELIFKQYYMIAEEAINKLPAGKKKVLKMSVEQGLTLEEIALKLNISKAGVKKQLYSATAFVRQYLRDNGEMSLILFLFISLFDPQYFP